jgi:glutamate/tyrosine decarboxylase-like PLP-dependent enzyme
MADLDIGWAVSTEFPQQPLATEQWRAHLADARDELLAWDDPARARLGFAMSAPSAVAVSTLVDFLPLNANNVGHHARFGEGKTGTRRLEKEALAALGGLLHGGALDGYLTAGATEAAIASLRIGRNTLRAAGARRPRVLAGELCHHSLVKAAEVLDLEFTAIPAGPAWVVDQADFERVIHDALRAGCDGLIIAATAGYYNSGLCDPVDAMARHARRLALEQPDRLHVYVHVDAAHGGLVYPFTAPDLCFDFRNPGVHAIALDPHKSGLMPYSCGVLLTRMGLFEHATDIDANTSIPDETLLGSRSGAMAAALWAVIHSLGHDGYALVARDCMRKRDALKAAVMAADPQAELVAAPHAPVLAAAFSTGLLPAGLCEDYRLIPISLPAAAGCRRLFYHFYAGASLTDGQIGAFATALADAVRAARPARHAAERGRPRDDEVIAAVRAETDCFRHFVVHPDGRRDPAVRGYSFHTFEMRRTVGEQLQRAERGRARDGGPLHIYAPDLQRPFANELFGVATDRFSLEILDRHQQELSLVGAIHASVPLPEHGMRALLNFAATGALRSIEYKLLGRELTDEIQIFPDRVVFKIGKSAAGFRRPRSDDYSFSIDTSAEVRVQAVDGRSGPAVTLMRLNADPLLPRRRHLRREQFRRFPNRFFDLEVEVTVGREWAGRAAVFALPGADLAGPEVLAHSARLGPCQLTASLASGCATITAVALRACDTAPLRLRGRWDGHSEVFGLMPVLNVQRPESLEIDEVVAYAEQVYACFCAHGLPEFASGCVTTGGGR